MSRKRNHRRRPVTALPPRGLRPRLPPEQLTTIGIVHMTNLDDIAKGRGTEEVLWHVVEAAFTWSRVAEKLQQGHADMAVQLELATRLVERYGRTGIVAFTGLEYQVAKLGTQVMDLLTEMVDEHTAREAALWSGRQVARLSGVATAASRETARG